MCSLPQLERASLEGKWRVADIRIDAPDSANGVRHEELMGFRCWFVLHREAFANESWALAVQGTLEQVETYVRIVASTQLTPNIHCSFRIDGVEGPVAKLKATVASSWIANQGLTFHPRLDSRSEIQESLLLLGTEYLV